MTRRVDFDEWQRVRAAIETTQTRILAVEEGPRAERLSGQTGGRPTEGRPLHSHRPRSDEEWQALEEGVRGLMTERESSGRWTQVGSRRVAIGS
jgi:hypothetical protein